MTLRAKPAGASCSGMGGPPMPDRPKGMGQTKRDTPALQRWGFVDQASNLSTVKNCYAQRTSKKPRILIDDSVKTNARTRATTRTNRNAPTAKERKKRQWRKNIIRIATWNTRSWNNKAQEILIELNHKTTDICAISGGGKGLSPTKTILCSSVASQGKLV
jgi:hypothetical protein